MASVSRKQSKFVSEPMRNKPVTELPGIGKARGKRLNDKGYNMAYHILAKFLLLSMNRLKFQQWLQDTCGANIKEQKQCYDALQGWCDSFL